MQNKVSVSIISNIFNPVGPAVAGGLEVFNYYLTKELLNLKVDVKLYASGDSEDLGNLVPIVEESLAYSKNKDYLSIPWNYRRMTVQEFGIYTDFIQKEKGDRLIHFSLVNFLPIYLAVKKGLPAMTTIHMPIDNAHYQLLKNLLTPEELKRVHFIGISKAQVKDFPVEKIIHNGVSTKDFQFSPQGRDAFIWLGRMIPEKGCPDAIVASKKADVSLEIGGEPKNATEEEFFQKEIQPQIQNKISYKGFIREQNRNQFYAAKALIFTPKWEEPFGLIMTESLACGTPVIAYDQGAVSEVIEDGVTGFIVPQNDIEGLVGAIEKIQALPLDKYSKMRQNCREVIEKKFSFEKVAEEYLQTYQEIWNSKLERS
jgi:glycosyltransferase involved in cell wall biosynthesis